MLDTLNPPPSAEAALAGGFPDQGIRPLAALGAVARLMRNPQDTRQVARIEAALAGRAQAEVFARFAATPHGAAVLRERRSLVPALDDHAALASLPETSLGRHYLAFMRREGLTAQGLFDATPDYTAHLAGLPEPVRVFSDYTQRGSHDLYHVLGGYGRDELGEICVLAMGYQQLRIRGYAVIAYLGALVVRKYLRRAGVGAGGVFAALREAGAIGRAAAWLPAIDMAAALPEDLDALRRRLNLTRPHRYEAVLDRLRAKHWHNGPFAGIRG